MPLITAWLQELDVTYPLVHTGDVNTVMFNVQLVSCGVGSEQIEETYDFIDLLMCAMEENHGKIKISIEAENDDGRKPEIIRTAMSDLQ